MVVHQTGLVLWRTLYVQALRRHWLATLLELLLVTLCFIQLRDHTRPKAANDGRPGFNPPVAYAPRPLAEIVAEGAPIGGPTVCYGPSTEFAERLMDAAYPRREQGALEKDSDGGGIWTEAPFDHVAVNSGADVPAVCEDISRKKPAHTVPCVRFYGDQGVLNYSVYVYTDDHITAEELAFRVPQVFKPPGEPSKLLSAYTYG
ncbi:uncharacterized protein LOC125943363 [Dermacentor silvarum]|uniref:uncharacterized protein LOC125943363 n=1 Tax=Dermacentor silvarum TaxID=543639 RepID=UPI002101CC87|nr:uncharacterized protein LOC125943363 [Dermacentor silvarum]